MTKHVAGARMPRADLQYLKNFEIPLPPLAEQKRIVAKLEKVLGKIKEAKRLRAEAQALATSLLPAELHKIFEEGKREGWEEKHLENVVQGVADGTHDTPEYQTAGYPLVTSKNLKTEGLSFDTAKFISHADYTAINKRSSVKNGDILIGMIGTIGNITRVETEREFSIKNVGLIRPDESVILSKYIMYFLHNSRLFNLITVGGTTQKFMALGVLRKIKIKYPPLPEQRRIVAHLDTLSEKITTLRTHQAQTALEKSVLHKAFDLQ